MIEHIDFLRDNSWIEDLTYFHVVTINLYILILWKVLVTADRMGFINVAEVDLG